jgi:hypothetical protein
VRRHPTALGGQDILAILEPHAGPLPKLAPSTGCPHAGTSERSLGLPDQVHVLLNTYGAATEETDDDIPRTLKGGRIIREVQNLTTSRRHY